MKKFLLILIGALALFTSCTCTSEKIEDNELVVENIISADKAYMDSTYVTYKWYETSVVFDRFLDEESNGEIVNVTNVFQVQDSIKSRVIMIEHADGDTMDAVIDGIWVGDFDLNPHSIVLSVKDAYERIQEANCPKPHSKNLVLRREVGPVPDVNPQYVFGNEKAQLYVDVVTGEVNTENPAFKGFE